jgi:tetratricopeptide (TPR) repeat protein
MADFCSSPTPPDPPPGDEAQRSSLVRKSKRPHASFPRIAGYRLLCEIGRGGMGVVYKARHLGLKRLVALKTIRDPEGLVRFRNEALAIARLQHPHIVQIYEHNLEPSQGPPYLCMELVAGGSLVQHLGGKPWPAVRAAQLVETLARAVQHAHRHHVAHRDLKPANVLLTLDGTPKISDFGLAKLLDRRQHLTQTGSRVGTYGYMAPEQVTARPGPQWPLVDVHGLGVILYETLTGYPPFQGVNEAATLRMVLEVDPVPPRRLHRDVPRDLETICLKCLEKDPRRRYPTAEALAEDLACFLRGAPVRARPLGPLGRGWRWCRRKPVAAALLLSLLVGFGASLALGIRSEAARRESEEHVTMLRQLMTNNVHVNALCVGGTSETDVLPETMLIDAEACLTRLLQKRAEDQELRVLLADVLTCLGMRRASNESLVCFEKAALLWDQIPPATMREPRHLVSRATTYRYLGVAYSQQGRLDRAVQAKEISFRLWKQLAKDHPHPLYQDGLFYSAFELGLLLIESGHSEEQIWRRFQNLHTPPDLWGGGQGSEMLLDSLRVYQLCVTAEKHYQAKEPDAGLAAARKAATILDRYDGPASLDRRNGVRLARPSVTVSSSLRRGGAPREALRPVERVNRWLQDLVLKAPEAHFFVELSQSWHQIGKARWELDQAEGTLDAFRHALAAQRQACTLVPAVAEYRQELGRRYLQLGRKLCELGRLDEAEACFRERQGLWPDDAAKRAEPWREVQKWADQIPGTDADLSPAKRQERQRYLDLAARLTRMK